MEVYDPNPQIIQLSLNELEKIIAWISKKGASQDTSSIILIGGWAVDVYNDYLGSVDIDLVVDGNSQQELIGYLKTDPEYKEQIHYPGGTVKKVTPSGEIIIDFMSKEIQYPFEGDPGVPFTFDILTGNTTSRNVRGRGTISVPNRSILVILKLKAAWDRHYRLTHKKSAYPPREKGKLIKDYTDVLALIDPEKGGREVNIEIIGKCLSNYPFLKDIIRLIPKIDEVTRRYEKMDKRDIEKICENLYSIV